MLHFKRIWQTLSSIGGFVFFVVFWFVSYFLMFWTTFHVVDPPKTSPALDDKKAVDGCCCDRSKDDRKK